MSLVDELAKRAALGAARFEVPVPPEDEPAPDPTLALLTEVRDYLRLLPSLLAPPPPPPAPVVHVEPQDLSAIVTAVNGLRPGATAADIAEAIAARIAPQAVDHEPMVAAMKALVDKIDFRLQGVGRAFGASGPSNISDNPDRQLGIVSLDGSLTAVKLLDAAGTNELAISAAGAAKVDGSAVTQPVSGTVTANPPALPAAPLYGQTKVATTSTAVQMPSHALTTGVIVQALDTNVADIYVGDSSVTTSTGFQLQAGQATSVAVANTNAVYVNGTAGDGVCFIGS